MKQLPFYKRVSAVSRRLVHFLGVFVAGMIAARCADSPSGPVSPEAHATASIRDVSDTARSKDPFDHVARLGRAPKWRSLRDGAEGCFIIGTDSAGGKRIAYASPDRLPTAVVRSDSTKHFGSPRVRERHLQVQIGSTGAKFSMICSISSDVSDTAFIRSLTEGSTALTRWARAASSVGAWRHLYRDTLPPASGSGKTLREEFVGSRGAASSERAATSRVEPALAPSLQRTPAAIEQPRFTVQLATVYVYGTPPQDPYNDWDYYDLLEQHDAASGSGGLQVVDTITYSEPDDPYIDPRHECAASVAPEPTVDFSHTGDQLCPHDRNNICIDVFIPDSVAGGMLLGDNRQTNPDAPFTASRAQIVLYPENGTYVVHVSQSCARRPLPFLGQCSPPLPVYPNTGAANHVSVIAGSDGGYSISIQLRNSVLQFSRSYPTGPAINVDVTLVPDGHGGFLTTGVRNSYPALDIFQWKDGDRTSILHLAATNPTALIDVLGQTQAWCVP